MTILQRSGVIEDLLDVAFPLLVRSVFLSQSLVRLRIQHVQILGKFKVGFLLLLCPFRLDKLGEFLLQIRVPWVNFDL